MKKKINVNTASKKELMKLKGIGNVGADRIIASREKGGSINSVEELQKITKMSKGSAKGLKADIDFSNAIDNSNDSSGGVILHTPVFVLEGYYFTVKLNGLQDYTGYQLTIGYTNKLFALLGIPTNGTNQTKTYDLDQSDEVNVFIPKPTVGYTSKEFNLQLMAPNGEVVYNANREIEENDTVSIAIPTAAKETLFIKVNKQPSTNYDDYILSVEYTINQGESGLQTNRQDFEIANQSEIAFNIHQHGNIQSVKIAVKSPNGLIISSLTEDWDNIGSSGGKKSITIDLPAPSSLQCNIQLIADPDAVPNPFADHSIVVIYDIKDPNDLSFIRRVQEQFPILYINEIGQAHITFKHYGLIEEVEFQVKAPGGEIIGTNKVKRTDINEKETIFINVPPRKLANLAGLERLPERPQKTVGKIIDPLGKHKFVGTQIVFYVADTEKPEKEDFYPLLVAQSEEQGYFVVDTPKGYFTAAFARVGVNPKENVIEDIPIRLEKDSVLTFEDEDNDQKKELVAKDKLFFPARLILVVDDFLNEDDEDCDCNDCDGLEIKRDKRVLDEFSYYSVVRITEPNIQGFTLEEDGEMTIQDVINTIGVDDSIKSTIPAKHLQKGIRKSVLFKFINNKKGLTSTTLLKALNVSNALKLREKLKPKKDVRAIGRHQLNSKNVIDWDEDPTIYQATTLAHGHILQFKQEWESDGYSFGDLLYSLPLAPGQKKQIVVYDWDREDHSARRESRMYQESLYNSLSSDRDVNEVVRGVLTENIRGGSKASTGGWAAGAGAGGIFGAIGGLLGIGGGRSSANSSAWQNSSRQSSMNNLQSIRQRTIQSANAVRGQRVTVINTSGQSERMAVQTETVANYNHCHSITIQYFEVLRHLQIKQRLASVQECLFVPLIITPFDHQKILRWRESMSRYIFNRRLRKGFNAIERIENNYEGSDFPTNRYADENVTYLEGEFMLRFNIAPPINLNTLESIEAINNALAPFIFFGAHIVRHITSIIEAEANRRNELFMKHIAPEIAYAFVDNLEFEIVTESGRKESVNLNPTLISSFRNNTNLKVTVRQEDLLSLTTSRANIQGFLIKKATGIVLTNGEALAEHLPSNAQIIVQSGSIFYRTNHSSSYLFRKNRILDDLVGYEGSEDSSEHVFIATPLNNQELRNPRNEDLELANALQDHLNDNLEYYHKVIWMRMSPERRFMFLDGIQVTDYSEMEEYPGGVVRSVASVVENRVIGIVGNSLVMPVAPGFRLNPNTKGEDVDLLSLYEPLTPIEPIKVSLPTKGVFAEAMMGHCNSCEKIDNNRFWRWEDSPIPDNPTSIGTVSTDSRYQTPADTTPTDFPQNLINIQNTPNLPDPQGFDALQKLLGTSSFKDITGLDQNQKNALAALQASFDAAKSFGDNASKLTMLGAKLNAIKEARKSNLISSEEAQKAFGKALDESSDSKTIPSKLDALSKIDKMVKDGKLTKEDGQKAKQTIIDSLSEDSLLKELNIPDSIKDATKNPKAKIKVKDGDQEVEIIKGGTGQGPSGAPSTSTATTDITPSALSALNIKIERTIVTNNSAGTRTIEYTASSTSLEDYEITIEHTPTGSTTQTVSQIVPPGASNISLLIPSNPNSGFSTNIKWQKGNASATIAAGTKFLFPFPLHTASTPNEFECTQSFHNTTGGGSNSTHTSGSPANAFAVDFAMPMNTPIYAARDGVVIALEESKASSPTGSANDNNYVRIRHSDGTYATYDHLAQNSVPVNVGDAVTAGTTLIGKSNNSGASFGPHLHFAVQILTATGWKSIAFVFDNGSAAGVTPVKGTKYKRT